MALVNDVVVGFIELEPDGHIDCMYTWPDFQGMGVASALYRHILKLAIVNNMNRLFVEASHIAKPFFASREFDVVKKMKCVEMALCWKIFQWKSISNNLFFTYFK